jgi:membrane-associated HD superfamily phosphohydrolase
MHIPWVWDRARHIQTLKDSRDSQCPNYFFIEAMHSNIRAAIHAYETNQMFSRGMVYLKRGQMVSEQEAKNLDDLDWREVRCSIL